MQLSSELWKTLLNSIRCEHRKNLPEKRKHPRVQIRARVSLTPLTNGQPSGNSFEVWTRDVSVQGISFTIGECLSLHQQFLIELPQKRGAPVRLLASIRQCRKLAEHIYFVGMYYEPLGITQSQPSSAASATAA